jgi:hypothetical protein
LCRFKFSAYVNPNFLGGLLNVPYGLALLFISGGLYKIKKSTPGTHNSEEETSNLTILLY